MTECGPEKSAFAFRMQEAARASKDKVSTTSFHLENQKENLRFAASWTTYAGDGIARLTIKEKDPLYPRYVPSEVLLDTPLSAHTIDAASGDLLFGHHRIRLDPSGRSFDLLTNDTLVLQLNPRGFLSYEHSRQRAVAVDADAGDDQQQKEEASDEGNSKNNDADDQLWCVIDSSDGGWDETFGTHSDSKPRGPQSVSMDIRFVGSQHVYGIPEHASSFKLKDTRDDYTEPYRLYNLDVFEYEIDNPMALYGSVPIMIAHSARQTVGVFWSNSAETWIDVNYQKAAANTDTHWMSEAGDIDLFIFFGPSPADVLRQIAQVTGSTYMPPLFSLGYHQCRWNYKNQEDVAEVDAGFDHHQIPYDVIWLDIEHTDGKRYFTWNEAQFPSPKAMQEAIGAKGRRMVTIVDPHIKRDNQYFVHKQASEKGYYVKKRDGSDYEGWCWPGSSSWIDYTVPAARFWWGELFRYDNYVGSTPFLYTWNDMNEPSVFNGPEVTMHKDALHYGQVEHRELHNVVGLEFHKATAMGLIKRSPGDSDRPFVLSRAFYAGTQRWGAIWTGDNAAAWEHLEISTPMLLSIGMTGIPFVGADVGGFFGNPEPELLTRWYQAGAFQPFFRGHAHLDSARREPWLFGEPYTTLIREAIKTRYNYLAYWYTLFYESTRTGAPPMRPLWFNFPTDANLFALEDQFMVGSDLLVKPIAQAGVTSTTIYLPAPDQWYDIRTFQMLPGRGRAEPVQAPLDKIPVYQRGGSIIPTWERTRRSSSQMQSDPFTLVVALDANQFAAGNLYFDDGVSLSSSSLNRHFVFHDGVLTSTATHQTWAAKNQIERIRILGYSRSAAPSAIVLKQKPEGQSNEVTTPLTFSFDPQLRVIVIRKPGVSISTDFRIELRN